MEKLVLVPYEKYQRLLDGKTMEKKTPNPPKRRERTVLKKRVHPGNGINRALRLASPLKTGSHSELRKKNHPEMNERPLTLEYREEERHRALGRDATFSWSRALTHPPRCNRMRHRGRHLVSDFVGPPSWTSRRGGHHLGSEVVGPPSWI